MFISFETFEYFSLILNSEKQNKIKSEIKLRIFEKPYLRPFRFKIVIFVQRFRTLASADHSEWGGEELGLLNILTKIFPKNGNFLADKNFEKNIFSSLSEQSRAQNLIASYFDDQRNFSRASRTANIYIDNLNLFRYLK